MDHLTFPAGSLFIASTCNDELKTLSHGAAWLRVLLRGLACCPAPPAGLWRHTSEPAPWSSTRSCCPLWASVRGLGYRSVSSSASPGRGGPGSFLEEPEARGGVGSGAAGVGQVGEPAPLLPTASFAQPCQTRLLVGGKGRLHICQSRVSQLDALGPWGAAWVVMDLCRHQGGSSGVEAVPCSGSALGPAPQGQGQACAGLGPGLCWAGPTGRAAGIGSFMIRSRWALLRALCLGAHLAFGRGL